MPCGGGSVGLNVWVEQGDILFYMARGGAFDENNALLKLGRIRVKLSPNPLAGKDFSQKLNLKDGSIYIQGQHNGIKANVHLWVDVFNPVIHVSVKSNENIHVSVGYENWRSEDRIVTGKENLENSYKFAPQGVVKVYKDQVQFKDQGVLFYHRNQDTTIFDVTVQQQGLDSVKSQMFNPLKHLTFGGLVKGKQLYPAGKYSGTYMNTDYSGWRLKSKKAASSFDFSVSLQTAKTPTIAAWENKLQEEVNKSQNKVHKDWKQTKKWWANFWERSFIFIDNHQKKEASIPWQSGRNYQLFRYMLACNAFGSYPTKFNGGLFTYDPVLVDSSYTFTPDFRRWGGGTFTAQNQRLVYYPMLKNGDFEMMKPAFDFYLRLLHNATLRSEIYWGHEGASFTEQLENFGLPNCSEYGWERPGNYDKGMQYNAWLEYEWDTVLEFGHMILQMHNYSGKDISKYIPLIESCLVFFKEHYEYLAKKRGKEVLDGEGHLVLFPGSAAETYKMAYNATSTIAALKTVLKELLALPKEKLSSQKRPYFKTMLDQIPPMSFRQFEGHKTIAPAALWQRINNTETPQLYPVFPWHIYGVGKPDPDIALNTWKYDTDAIKHRGYKGWKQDNIFAACLGLTEEATDLTFKKLKNSGRRFPAFWGPGFDWTPDHNWGGSGMIGLQEMLLQTKGDTILLFPAWPKREDVHFKLHAPDQTVVEASLQNGKLDKLQVTPQSRAKDIKLMLSDE